MSTIDRDDLIRLALTPPAGAHSPADLGASIYREVLATPQRRGLGRLGRLGWLPVPSPLLVTLGMLALLGLAIAIAALSQPAPPPVLSGYHGGPDRTGVMPGPGPAGEPVIAWDAGRPGALPFNTMPLPVAGRVVVGDVSGSLAALDPATGTLGWELDVGSPIRGAPATADDVVFVGTDAGEVIAAHAVTGKLVWRADLGEGAVRASLLVAGGVLYAGTDGGSVVALEPGSGRRLWSMDAGGRVARGPAFADGVLYVGSEGGRFSAIDVATRTVRWAAELGAGEVGTPTVGGGRVYVGTGLLAARLGNLVAMDVRDGSVAWTFASAGGEPVHMGGLATGRAYVASEDGNLYALDARTGEVIWASDVGERLTTPIAIVGEVLFLSAEPRSVHALDADTGERLWAVQVVGNPSSLSVVGGRVFVGTDLGRVVAIGGTGELPSDP
jgi:eukaryotic-like serine/threonine-protein kinase